MLSGPSLYAKIWDVEDMGGGAHALGEDQPLYRGKVKQTVIEKLRRRADQIPLPLVLDTKTFHF
jgi:hypothetical protein